MTYRYLVTSAVGLAIISCSAQKAVVSGTVRFKGRPLPAGTVLFHGTDGRVEHSLISEEGKYTISDAPIGIVSITVKSHGAAPPKLPSSKGKSLPIPRELAPRDEDLRNNHYVPIPDRYLNPDTSGLTFEVHPGRQSRDIELEP